MKRILMLLILMSFCQGVFSLEITYIKEIDVLNQASTTVGFCDDAQNIIYGNVAFNIQDETIIKLDFSEGQYRSLNRFGYFSERDKFFRSQNVLFSLVYGSKSISKEVIDSLTNSNRMSGWSGDEWTMHLYGNASIRRSDFKVLWDSPFFGIDFFSDENQMVDVPIEMKYGISSRKGTGLSYDLFTGVFHEERYWEGKGDPYAWMAEDFKRSDTDPKSTGKLHIFNLIYNGNLTSKTEIRETPSHEGKVLGYLNEGESVKVSKAENYEKREMYQDYWYYVTTDSYSGWCSGEFLLIEGDTWIDRLELRGHYVEWDDIPESENTLKKPLYGLILSDTNLYELLEVDLLSADEIPKPLETYPISENVQKNSIVEVLDRTRYVDDLNSRNWGYNKIRLENGIEGWILGDDIDIDLKDTRNLATTGIPDEIDESTVIKAEPVNSKSPERHGVINDTRVRLRREPNLETETLEYLNTGDEVTVIAKTTEKQKIDDMEDYWYKVNKVKEGGYPTGWVYGAFVDFAVEEVVTEDTADVPDITVATNEKNTAIPWVIGGAILLLGAIIGAVIIVKKKKS